MKYNKLFIFMILLLIANVVFLNVKLFESQRRHKFVREEIESLYAARYRLENTIEEKFADVEFKSLFTK